MDENISRAAGASHGQELTDDDFRAIAEPLGRTLEQRTTLYGRIDRRPAPPARGAAPADAVGRAPDAPDVVGAAGVTGTPVVISKRVPVA